MFLGYNYRIMLTVLLIFAGLFCGTQNYVPFKWSQQQEHPRSHTAYATPYAPSLTTPEIDKENADNAERYAYYKAHPKEYLKVAFAPANASNWVLSGLGVAASLIGIFTLLSIKRQAASMDKQNTIILNEKRPRLLIQPQPFTAIINGVPDIRIRVTNIGGSKAIFGLCLAGMEATELKEVAVSKRKTNTFMLKRLTNKILESGESHEEEIQMFFAQVFPSSLDKSNPYKLHIYGVLVFGDILFEDIWMREFHYVVISTPSNTYMVQFGKMANEFWYPMMEEVDRKRKPQSRWNAGISWIGRTWTAYKLWVETQESDYQ
jgi:hypothetical protein